MNTILKRANLLNFIALTANFLIAAGCSLNSLPIHTSAALPSSQTSAAPDPATVDANPMLLFTDLASGPSTGNSDSSQLGQIAGQDGAIVTVWGKYLGAVTGQIIVGGLPARIYSWINATAPANLYTQHKMQMISFQIPHGISNGATTIQALVGGKTSNAIPFTVRSGHIYYVKTSGDDTNGNGSWSTPWKTLSSAVKNLFPGDTLYVCDGVQQITQDGDRSTMNLEYAEPDSQLANQNAPKAMVAYPNATVKIGSVSFNASWSTFVGGSISSSYWTIAKLWLTGHYNAAVYGPGFRLVGNYITAPQGDSATGGVAGGDSTNLFVLGNELTQIGFAGTSKLYHPMYIQSLESSTSPRLPEEPNREIGWNYLHDNYAYDGINIYREGTYSAFMTHTSVHDNYILNQTGRGMLVGAYIVGPDNYFYNNIIIHAGIGPASNYTTDPAYGYVCVDFLAGWADYSGTTTIHFYNNTLYGCGFTDSATGISGGMLGYAAANPFVLDFHNNIVQSTGFPFVGKESDPFPASSGTKNLWFGNGAAPSFDLAPVLGDPLFANPASGDMRLQKGSAAVDAGSSTGLVPKADFDNNPRPQGAGCDIGAFESSATQP